MIKLSTAYTKLRYVYVSGVPSATTPTAVLYRNGASSGVTVTVAAMATTGLYKFTWTTLGTGDGWAEEDQLDLEAKITVDSQDYPNIVWSSDGEIDEKMRGTDNALPSGNPVTLTTAALNSINAEVDTALSDYDGPTKTEMDSAFTEIKGATWSASTDTLEAIRDRGDVAWVTGSGSGGGGGDATLANQTTIINHLTDIKGSGWSSSTDTLEKIRDRGDAAWLTATGFSTHNAGDIWSESPRTLTSLGFVLNSGDFAASSLYGKGDWNTVTPNTVTPPTVVQIRTEMDDNSTKLTSILDDTNELQTDWTDGGRLDLILDDKAGASGVTSILEDTGTTLPATLSTITKLLEASKYIDTTDSAQWKLVYVERDSGDLSTGTVLLTQNLKQIGGTPVTSSDHYIGITEDTS